MEDLIKMIPSAEELLTLTPEELASIVLQILNIATDDQTRNKFSLLSATNFFRQAELTYRDGSQREIARAVAEAWSILVSSGMIAQDPSQEGSWHFVTRRGRELNRPEEFKRYFDSRSLSKDLLHPLLVEKCWASFSRGEFDVAVHIAYREIEIQVRAAGNYPDSLIGRDLMQKAYGTNGALIPLDYLTAESDGLRFLFMGAMGWHKNPQSHRVVGLKDRRTAIEALMFASHLLYLNEWAARHRKDLTAAEQPR